MGLTKQYILRGVTKDGKVGFYNGRAGNLWLSDNRSEAFPLSLGVARTRAGFFNSYSSIHGVWFTVQPVLTGPRIEVSFVYPPIPIRDFDYQAVFDDYDGAPDAGWQCHGSGRNEFQAVLSFYEEWENMRDEPLVAHRPGFMEDLYA